MPPTVVDRLRDHALASTVKAKARALGFDLVGVAPADPSRFRDYFRRWLDDGRHGEMAYLANRFDERVDPRAYLPGARSVVCVALNYYCELEPVPEADRRRHGRVARYALGQDYHEVIKKRLQTLADWLRETVPGTRTVCGVDTAPILEREMAARAGVGWVGKNTCVISREAGSFLLLGQVLTTLDLPPDEPDTDHCGTCTRCLDACPTGAITAPYELDATRCISYLTIEHRGEIAADLQRQMGDWVYGCDVCQEVCPHNRAPPAGTDPALRPRVPTGTIDVEAAKDWTTEAYHAATRHSAMRRVKLPQFQRNAAIAWRNLQATAAAGPAE
ncbi:MAG: 4Fe-4S ferredoxin, iron-sulfur binding protein [Phycisphaerales bacterium]|nr:4Fe-4S ferredoxin, iron-sulfur binding protein [Phycisphaerales bacterium]